MISGDAWLVASATIGVLGLQQWLMFRQNRKTWTEWINRLQLLLEEYPLHRHEKDGTITYPRVRLGSPERNPAADGSS